MDKTLIVYASFGEGHKKAAESLREYLNAPCKDLLDFSHPFIKNFYASGYIFVTERISFFWRLLFSSTGNRSIGKIAERIQEFLFFSFFAYLRRTKPQVVIVTHFFPLSFLARLKQELSLNIVAVVTDIHAHPLWINSCVDYYFAAFDETKNNLLRQGVEEKRILTGYAALRSGFLREESVQVLRRKFSLDEKPCLLFMSSVRGTAPFLTQVISQLAKKFNIFVIYGKNIQLKEYLESTGLTSIRLFPVYERIWELFELSSVIITKPGGLTIFEGIFKKKPFIFTQYIPGQEEENMKFIMRYDIARFAHTELELLASIEHFMNTSGVRNEHYPLALKDIRPALDALLIEMRPFFVSQI
ncbi:MAG: hypothetical protein WCI77_09185 [Candidatus Omnitrophota bacterium]